MLTDRFVFGLSNARDKQARLMLKRNWTPACAGATASSATPLKLEHALAGGLGVEEFVGGFRLVQFEAVGEQAFHVDAVLDHEARAVRLALLAEGPGAEQGQLAPDHVRADLQRHLAALANVADLAPGA